MPNHQHSRILTVMEGRSENHQMVTDFAAAAKAKGWGFHQIFGINSDKIARLDFADIPLDFVIFRELSLNNYHEAERLMHWLRNNRKICINANIAGGRISTSDKHFQQGLFMMDSLLSQYALPTFEAKHKANVLSYLHNQRIHLPFVLKDRRGTAGKNITLIRRESDLDQIDDFQNLLIEQYIKPECDYRVFVIGGVAVGAMRKTGDLDHPGDFRAWSGGRDKHLERDPSTLDLLSEIATRAAAVSHLEYAGVDIIKEADTGKFYLLETNIAAGWGNDFISVTNVDIPALVINWLESRDRARHQPTHAAVQDYLDTNLQYLPSRIQDTCVAISEGTPDALTPYCDIFAKYPSQYLYDAGKIFTRFSKVYQNFADGRAGTTAIIREIESMPLSWAGNFIGPEVGTFHDGAILSALYLYLLGKIREV